MKVIRCSHFNYFFWERSQRSGFPAHIFFLTFTINYKVFNITNTMRDYVLKKFKEMYWLVFAVGALIEL